MRVGVVSRRSFARWSLVLSWRSFLSGGGERGGTKRRYSGLYIYLAVDIAPELLSRIKHRIHCLLLKMQMPSLGDTWYARSLNATPPCPPPGSYWGLTNLDRVYELRIMGPK